MRYAKLSSNEIINSSLLKLTNTLISQYIDTWISIVTDNKDFNDQLWLYISCISLNLEKRISILEIEKTVCDLFNVIFVHYDNFYKSWNQSESSWEANYRSKYGHVAMKYGSEQIYLEKINQLLQKLLIPSSESDCDLIRFFRFVDLETISEPKLMKPNDYKDNSFSYAGLFFGKKAGEDIVTPFMDLVLDALERGNDQRAVKFLVSTWPILSIFLKSKLNVVFFNFVRYVLSDKQISRYLVALDEYVNWSENEIEETEDELQESLRDELYKFLPWIVPEYTKKVIADRLIEFFSNKSLNKQMFLMMLDTLLLHVFPEFQSQKIVDSLFKP